MNNVLIYNILLAALDLLFIAELIALKLLTIKIKIKNEKEKALNNNNILATNQ